MHKIFAQVPKAILAAVLIPTIFAVAWALNSRAFQTPYSAQGVAVTNMDLVGWEVTSKAVNETNTTAAAIFTGAGLLKNVVISTGATTLFMQCADIGSGELSALTTGQLFPPIFAATANVGSLAVLIGNSGPYEVNEALRCDISGIGGYTVYWRKNTENGQ